MTTGNPKPSPHRAAVAIAVTVLALATASCSGTTSKPSASGAEPSASHATPAHATGPSAGCRAAPVAPGTTDARIRSGGRERSYLLDVPEGYDGRRPYAVVFGLHSLSIDYRVVPASAGFPELHRRYRFIGVAPSGLVSGVPFWNAAPVADNYDVVFLTRLLDHLERTLCVDTARVFSLGMSNGAQMSSLLACRLPGRIAAIGAIAGVEFPRPCAGEPVPVIAFHGRKDPVVPYAGGGLSSVAIADQHHYHGDLPPGTPTPTGVDASMASWARHNRCDPDPAETRVSAEVGRRVWKHCAAATEIYVADEDGHSWPGRPEPAFEKLLGPTTTDIDATRLIGAFFFRHRA
ncbi:MAG: hypothetical protein IT197_04255 [Acidimicrobiia bacterium]|nr:hypothetical protein [Acidimicrobiia bacterium]